ncbi:GntR family transcriptional regulator [Tessaracoccus antarcticus]|uniref:GntR family transcriptional regulator n=1 Tax=Tessaracoccus antarcticus TaxID=2479848 RepID=A0A3M0GRC2_9ACTN|nr:GntR family transcriptional regulator [Tessaracoccus antarcticus]RMB59826.1 GntR family transcriptional regulator [Tessaracoccus antarcticus]
MSRITGAERVYQAVYADIQGRVLRPGEVVREDMLAKQYGLSRTPVREALRRLVQDGLCEKHGSGLRISLPTLDQVHEIYPIVSVLEGLAARLCAEQMTSSTLEELESLDAGMRDMSAAGDTAAFVEANQQFHDVILMTSNNASLVQTVQRLRLITLALRRYQLRIGSRMDQSSGEHRVLMNAFRSRDGPAAEEAMRRHVDSGHHILVTALSRDALFDPHEEPTPGPDVHTQEPVDPSHEE